MCRCDGFGVIATGLGGSQRQEVKRCVIVWWIGWTALVGMAGSKMIEVELDGLGDAGLLLMA